MNDLEYYLCSEAVVKAFPDLVKSKPFKSGYDWDKETNYYVVAGGDYMAIEAYYAKEIVPIEEAGETDPDFWIVPCCSSLVDYKNITKKECKKIGLFMAIENHYNLTKESNRAYVIYNLAKKFNCNPIEFINSIAK